MGGRGLSEGGVVGGGAGQRWVARQRLGVTPSCLLTLLFWRTTCKWIQVPVPKEQVGCVAQGYLQVCCDLGVWTRNLSAQSNPLYPSGPCPIFTFQSFSKPFFKVTAKQLTHLKSHLMSQVLGGEGSIGTGSVPMFPQPYVPTALCSHSPMFPFFFPNPNPNLTPNPNPFWLRVSFGEKFGNEGT